MIVRGIKKQASHCEMLALIVHVIGIIGSSIGALLPEASVMVGSVLLSEDVSSSSGGIIPASIRAASSELLAVETSVVSAVAVAEFVTVTVEVVAVVTDVVSAAEVTSALVVTTVISELFPSPPLQPVSRNTAVRITGIDLFILFSSLYNSGRSLNTAVFYISAFFLNK